MAYVKTEWKARKGLGLNRFTKEWETPNSVILENAPLEITEPGTPFSTERMNHIEQGIGDAHDLIAAETQARTAADTNLQAQVNGKAPASASLAAASGTGTDTATGAVQSNTVANIMQAIWNKIRQVANAAQAAVNLKEDKANKGAANGYASLDGNTKIPLSQLPDAILGQMVYGGTVNAGSSTAVTATLSTNAKALLGVTANTATLNSTGAGNGTTSFGAAGLQGCYFIASADSQFASLGILTGDWLISTADGWKKIDNTDAVTGVKGSAETIYRTGSVNITKANVGLGNVPDADATNAGNIATGTLAEARLPSLAVTAGNATTGATQLAAGTHTIKTIVQRLLDNAAKTFADLGNKVDKITAIAAVTTPSAKKVAYNAQGQITSTGDLGKADVGLGNVTNDAQVKRSEMGAANGVASLDAAGRVPSAQLPNSANGGDTRPATLVVGTSAAGHAANSVDYLCAGANDHTVINSAIAALPAGGGKIVIREGTYNLGGTINVNKNNVAIEGMGPSTVLKAAASITAANTGIINLTGSGCEIANLKVFCTYPVSAPTGVYISGSGNRAKFVDCANTAAGACYGVYITGSGNTVTRCRCANTGSPAYGVYLTGGGGGNTVDGNIFSGGISADNCCVFAGNSGGNIITGNMCGFSGYVSAGGDNAESCGIYLAGNCGGNTVTGNRCSNGSDTANGSGRSCGILAESGGNTITGNTIANTADSDTCYGIYISGGGNTVTGNAVANSGGGLCYGIYIAGDNTVVNGNTIANRRNSGQATSNTFALWISSGSDYCAVHGNNLRGVTEAGGAAYTVNGGWLAPLPGTTNNVNAAATIAALNTGGSIGFNIV